MGNYLVRIFYKGQLDGELWCTKEEADRKVKAYKVSEGYKIIVKHCP